MLRDGVRMPLVGCHEVHVDEVDDHYPHERSPVFGPAGFKTSPTIFVACQRRHVLTHRPCPCLPGVLLVW